MIVNNPAERNSSLISQTSWYF